MHILIVCLDLVKRNVWEECKKHGNIFQHLKFITILIGILAEHEKNYKEHGPVKIKVKKEDYMYNFLSYGHKHSFPNKKLTNFRRQYVPQDVTQKITDINRFPVIKQKSPALTRPGSGYRKAPPKVDRPAPYTARPSSSSQPSNQPLLSNDSEFKENNNARPQTVSATDNRISSKVDKLASRPPHPRPPPSERVPLGPANMNTSGNRRQFINKPVIHKSGRMNRRHSDTTASRPAKRHSLSRGKPTKSLAKFVKQQKAMRGTLLNKRVTV